jgi:PKD repeat protein
MRRLLSLIRRHPRLFAGSAVILLAGTALFALRSAGSAHAAPGSAHVPTSSSAVASTSRPQPSTRPAGVASASTTAPQRLTGHAGATTQPGTPAPPPTSGGVSSVLRQATGLSPSQVTVRKFCPPAATGRARCAGEALVLRSNGALVHPHITARGPGRRVVPAPGRTAPAGGGAPASSAAPPMAYTPAYLQQAYDLSWLSQSGGSGDTVAIVDAYDDPTAESDLSAYRSFYGLPACTSASGCFRKVNQTGGSTPPAFSDPGWVQEISLDLDAVSAICPNCHILLVEANSSSLSDLNAAMQTAHTLGANQISDSWSATQSSAPAGTYTFPGVATVAATGDAGYVGPYQDSYPAALPGVTAAGGTTLGPTSGGANPRGFSEGAWIGGGSGCASGIHKPAYQSDTGCHGRSYADLSADADPNTGLAVYANGAWYVVGGTSLATPVIAAYYAITGANNSTPQWAYGNAGAFNDIVSGSNGGCGAKISYICTAGPGYDGPTGVGSISGDAVAGAPGIGGPAIAAGSGGNTYTLSTRSDGATITAGIYPNGHDTKWWIQYWPASGGSVQQTPAADIGSGTTAVSVTGYPSHLAPSTQYNYQLVATNSAGTILGYTYSFTTRGVSATTPVAAFTSSPAAAKPGSPVGFDASGSTDSGATVTDYSWDFGDGNTQDTRGTPTTSHAYANAGQYRVTLIVTNSLGQSETTTQTVTVDTPPTASFTPSPTFNTPAGFDASGSSDALGTITSYTWDFGDGSPQDTESKPTTSHTYAARGSYTIKLTVTNDAGQTAASSQTVTVDDPPALSLSPASTITPLNVAVSFNASASSPDTGGSIKDYSWDFGDGNTQDTGSTPTTSHTYTSAGTYRVTVTVTDDLGIRTTTTGQVTIDAPPTASFTAVPNQPTPGAAVNFDATGSTDSVGTITGYSWDFGDPGSASDTATGPNPVHIYAARGSYTVTLTVTNDAGQPATSTQTVTVDDPPTATLTPSSTLTTPGAPVSFSSVAGSPDTGGSIAGYSWNFGDPGNANNAATGPSTGHTYLSPGTYRVTVTVTDDLGVSTTKTVQVTVDATPTPAFTASSNPATAGSAVGFNAAGSTDTVGTITGYSWNFGDGNTASGQAPSHVYTSPGTYTVSLTVTNDAGQTATTSQTVTVNSVPTVTQQFPPTPAPVTSPVPTPAPAPTLAPAPTPLTAGLGAGNKQKVAAVLSHGLRVKLAVSQNATATFQVTLPIRESKLARRNAKQTTVVLLRTRARTVSAGTYAITLQLPRGTGRELAGTGPLQLTVRVTLTTATGGTVTRSVKITLTR